MHDTLRLTHSKPRIKLGVWRTCPSCRVYAPNVNTCNCVLICSGQFHDVSSSTEYSVHICSSTRQGYCQTIRSVTWYSANSNLRHGHPRERFPPCHALLRYRVRTRRPIFAGTAGTFVNVNVTVAAKRQAVACFYHFAFPLVLLNEIVSTDPICKACCTVALICIDGQRNI
jgi:hypothetical protein